MSFWKWSSERGKRSVMKKYFLAGAMVLAFVSTMMIGAAATTETASAAPRCDARNLGAPRNDAYTVRNDTATIRFKVTGPKNCRVQLTSNAFYAPTLNGQPWSKQILYQRVTKVYKPGTYRMSVGLPPKSDKKKGCFYQVDLTYGVRNKLPLVGFGHGKLDCSKPKPKKIWVCDLDTKEFIRINAKSFDRNKHSKDPRDCKEEEPKMIEVCELETKTRINIREDEFDSAIHSTNFSDCEEEPEVPEEPEAPETPEETPPELPETGALDPVMQLFGAGSLIASAGYYLQSRRQ